MNFQLIVPVPDSKTLLDVAFRRAREKMEEKKETGEWLDIIRKKEMRKGNIIKDRLISSLEKNLHSFPQVEDLSLFYQELFKLTVDYPLFKKSLGALGWAIKMVRLFQREYQRKISREKEGKKIQMQSRQFYGRISSVIKQINPNLLYLEEVRRTMRTYPDVKEGFTVCVYGFPNVGKTTLFNQLTGAKAEVAVYAFTTKGINAGYFQAGGQKIQVLDVPGTLARPEKRNNIEKQAELVIKELANLVIYVFDLSEESSYQLERQEQLWQKVSQLKKTLAYLSKKDLMDSPAPFKHRHYSLEELKEEILAAQA